MVPQTINFMNGEGESPNRSSREIKKSKINEGQGRRKKALFLLMTVLIIGVPWWYFNSQNKVDTIRARITLEPKKPKNLFKKISYIAFSKTNSEGVNLAGYKTDRINILLLGMGGSGHDGAYLTDTIMIASLKPSTKEIALISIPRDLGVNIPGYGYQKINHANAYGEVKQANWGGAAATELISKTFNIDIPYYIRLDFKAFEEIIDEMDGVTITVEKGFTDPMFPAAKAEYQTISFPAGKETMNGQTALNFARSRHGNNNEGSDFARARRQQKILLALKEKLTNLEIYTNPLRVNSIINSLESHLTTNMEFDELVSTARLVRTLKTEQITSLVLDSSPNGFLKNSFTAGGAYILSPKTNDFKAINQAIHTIFEPESVKNNLTPNLANTVSEQLKKAEKTEKINDPIIEIQNGTWNAGLAARVRRRLEFKNVLVQMVNNAENKPITDSKIYVLHKKITPGILESLIDELKISVSEELPTTIQPATSTEILIMLGDDFID